MKPARAVYYCRSSAKKLSSPSETLWAQVAGKRPEPAFLQRGVRLRPVRPTKGRRRQKYDLRKPSRGSEMVFPVFPV